MESIAQICLLGVTNSMQIRQKIYSMQKKTSRNPLSRNLAISKKILLKQFQEKKTLQHYEGFFASFSWVMKHTDISRTAAHFCKMRLFVIELMHIFSKIFFFQFSQNVTADFQLIYLLIFCVIKSR